MDIDPIDAWQEHARTQYVQTCIDALRPLFERLAQGRTTVEDALEEARREIERCAGAVSASDDRARVKRARRDRGEPPFS